ncbi:unnamed protein product [Amoebophrya sp. A25]|nr:unnamed protein product [Amoebophrya sp. A25]|eukprot:GSA25T00006880001.1
MDSFLPRIFHARPVQHARRCLNMHFPCRIGTVPGVSVGGMIFFCWLRLRSSDHDDSYLLIAVSNLSYECTTYFNLLSDLKTSLSLYPTIPPSSPTAEFETVYKRITCEGLRPAECPELPPNDPLYDLQKSDPQYYKLVDITQSISAKSKSYIRVSALNTMLIALRMLKFLRTQPRMIRLNQTLWNALSDTIYLILMVLIVLVGFSFQGHRVFGSKYERLADPVSSFYYVIDFVVGSFEFWPLQRIDSMLAVFFVFPMLFVFKVVLLNVFFAITDRWYIVVVSEADEVPAFNWKAKLKPYLGNILTFMEWDEDFQMTKDPNAAIKPKPPSRKKVVEDLKKECARMLSGLKQRLQAQGKPVSKELEALTVDSIYWLLGSNAEAQEGIGKGAGLGGGSLRTLLPPSMHDDRVMQVLSWSKTVVKSFLDKYGERFLTTKKGVQKETRADPQGEIFTLLESEIRTEKARAAMLEAEVQNAQRVFTRAAAHDQKILCRYILALEANLELLAGQRTGLEVQVDDLEAFNNAEEEGGGGGGGSGSGATLMSAGVGGSSGNQGRMSRGGSGETGATRGTNPAAGGEDAAAGSPGSAGGEKGAHDQAGGEKGAAHAENGAGKAAEQPVSTNAKQDKVKPAPPTPREPPPDAGAEATVPVEMRHRLAGRRALSDVLGTLDTTAKRIVRESLAPPTEDVSPASRKSGSPARPSGQK